ncbi:MAG TPA: hypothetical protein VND96_01505 [Candidatus Micrarchaeaceae archaeon]|nr:hypothetical protein [Candidatus Micrarchaeaceae archaeon]
MWAGPARYFHDTVGFLLNEPAVPNTLTLQTLLAYAHLPWPPFLFTVVILLSAGAALAFWRPKDLSDLLLASAAFAFIFFLMSRWAFFEYWTLVAYVLLAAILTTGAQEAVALPRWLPLRRWLRAAGLGAATQPSL